MILRFILAIGFAAILSGPTSLLAQGGKEIPGESAYDRYERDDVSPYRDQIRFDRPTPSLPAWPRVDEVEPISLKPYFAGGAAYIIDASAGLQQLVSLHQQIGQRTKTMEGYRILVYSGNSRNTALGVKSRLLAMNVGHKPYFKFEAPNFVVRLGDFMERENAVLFLRSIQDQYPSAFIVPDEINIPKFKATRQVEEDIDDPFAPIDDQ